MSNLARQEMHFQRFFTLDELVESIEEVTAEEVQRIAQTFFDQKHHRADGAGQSGRLSS